MICEMDKKEMVKTARSKGAVGKNAVLPRFILEVPDLKPHLILDFGCGKDAMHVQMLREQGFEYVYGVDLVPLTNPAYETNGFALPWHLVYASNVLNVQPSFSSLQCTVCKIADLSKHGVAYMSYPSSPRKLKMSVQEMEQFLSPFFQSVYHFSYRNVTLFKAVGVHCQKKLAERLTVFSQYGNID